MDKGIDSHKNVFKGSNSLKDYYNPDKCPPLPLVELPEQLNPFLKDGIHVYAKLMTALPASNVKSLPALNMLLNAGVSGEHSKYSFNDAPTTPPDTSDDEESKKEATRKKPIKDLGHSKMVKPKPHTIVEYSSGSTAISLGILGHIFGITQVHTFLSNKVSKRIFSIYARVSLICFRQVMQSLRCCAFLD